MSGRVSCLICGLVSAIFPFIFVACEDGGSDDGTWDFFKKSGEASTHATNAVEGSSSSALEGSWRLAGSDGSAWYIHFHSDGSWDISDDSAGNRQRVHGSYSSDGVNYSGGMKNPGVGEGTISGVIQSDTSITLDFCEHWHTPYKHVAYIGVKL